MKIDRGRQKITLVEVIQKNISIKEVIEARTLDRIKRRKRINVVSLTNLVEDP